MKRSRDATGQGGNRKSANADLKKRLSLANRRIKSLFKAIPSKRKTRATLVNSLFGNADSTTYYEYELSNSDRELLERSIQFELNRQLLETQTGSMPLDWYYTDYVELSFRQGTVQEVRDFSQSIMTAVSRGLISAQIPEDGIDPLRLLLSTDYSDRLAVAENRSFSQIRGLSEKTASQVVQRIASGIDAGFSPRAIVSEIQGRFDVAVSDAERIVRTEINRSYNDARMSAVDDVGRITGLRSGVIHVSAFLPTTRLHHGLRHGTAHTVEAQTVWWNTDHNWINCYCTVRGVLIDRSGRVVEKEFQDELIAQRVDYFEGE